MNHKMVTELERSESSRLDQISSGVAAAVICQAVVPVTSAETFGRQVEQHGQRLPVKLLYRNSFRLHEAVWPDGRRIESSWRQVHQDSWRQTVQQLGKENVFYRVLRALRRFRLRPHEKSLLETWERHRRPRPELGKTEKQSVLLVEASVDVAVDRLVPLFSFLDAFQREKAGTRTVGFLPDLVLEPMWGPALSRLRDLALFFLPSTLRRIYRACGIESFQLEVSSLQRRRASRKILSKFLADSPSKQSVLRWEVAGLRIGDLLYDHFLRAYRRPTLEPADPVFQAFAVRFLGMCLFWDRFFRTTPVSGVIVQNHEYGMGVPLRFAAKNGIPGFYLQMDSVITISKEIANPFNVRRHNLRGGFREAAPSERDRAVEIAKARLETRLNGGLDPEIAYMPSSAFSPVGGDRLLQDPNRINVLIATHSWYDACHMFGDSVFPDHSEWLEFLASKCDEHDFDWYLKKHPNFSKAELRLIEKFSSDHPSIRLLPSHASNHQLVEEGLSAVLTVFGSVGHEFPVLGVPVINCSVNTPHIDWDFNFHAGDEFSLDNLIREIPNLRVKSHAREQVTEFFAARIYRAPLEDPLFLEERPAGLSLVARGQDEKILHAWTSELKSGAYERTVEDLRTIVATATDMSRGGPQAAVFSKGRSCIVS